MKISREKLEIWLRHAAQNAIRENKALKLPYRQVVDDNLIEICPDGKVKILRKAKFGTVKVIQKAITLD